MYAQNSEGYDDTPATIRLLVDQKKAGTIIGKGGSTVSKLRTDSGANVDISKPVNGCPHRVVTIKANFHSASSVAASIASLLAEAKSDQSGDAETEITVLVGTNIVGSIIGKGGEKITSIRQNSGALIKISNQPLGYSTEKSVLIKGNPGSVHKALIAILNAMNMSGQDKNPAQLYVPHPEIQPLFNTFNQYGAMAGQQITSYGGAPVNQGPQQTLLLPVSEYLMGAVIGRGGSTINEIRQQSGANISIPQKNADNPERVLKITGSANSNEIAIALIHQRMAMFTPPNTQHQQQQQQQ